ncbi:MAG: hypothetical protein ACW96S_13640 [Promethearchaeota archaeon]|jgi:hypothetical protein
MIISDFGRDFLLLALRIGKHNKDYVDYYVGPKELSDKVDREGLVSPKKLLDDCKSLQNKLNIQGYDRKREKYLDKLITSIRTSVEILNGIEIPFMTKFSRLYDIKLKPVNYVDLENLKADVTEAFGGSESLEKSLAEIRERQKIPENEIQKLLNKSFNITKNRTKELFPDLLPQNEQIEIELVKDMERKWTLYNQYLGNYCSRIDININYGIYSTALLSSAAHEGYPGHHTEFAVKEERLMKKLNQYEHSILILNSPKLLISEGIADMAINMLYSYHDQSEIILQKFNHNLTKQESIDVLTKQNKVKGKIHLFWYNIAYLTLIEGWDEKRLRQYALGFKFYNERTINAHIKSLSDHVFSTTFFAYKIGRDLLINKYGEFPSINDFKTLLETPILPSDLA